MAINGRLLSSGDLFAAMDAAPGDAFCPIIVETNFLRMEITKAVLRKCARLLLEHNKPVRLHANFKLSRRTPAGVPAMENLGAILQRLSSKQTSDRDMVLDVFYGMRSMVNENVATEAGASNGGLVRLLGVQYPVGTTFENVSVDGGGVVRRP